MESVLPITMASILATMSASNPKVQEEAVISTYTLPEIAGLWELDLSQTESEQPILDNAITDESVKRIDDIGQVLPAEPMTAGTGSGTASCHERYNFGKDNIVRTTSGQEWTYSQYSYQPQDNGLPVLFIKTLYDNNQTDCSGNQVDQTNEEFAVFVDYRPETETMRWCDDALGEHCTVNLYRLLP